MYSFLFYFILDANIYIYTFIYIYNPIISCHTYVFGFSGLSCLRNCAFQAALEAPLILNLKGSKSFSGPYGTKPFHHQRFGLISLLLRFLIIVASSFLTTGEDVVFVCNDWHTAVLPCYLKTLYKPHGIYKKAKVYFA